MFILLFKWLVVLPRPFITSLVLKNTYAWLVLFPTSGLVHSVVLLYKYHVIRVINYSNYVVICVGRLPEFMLI